MQQTLECWVSSFPNNVPYPFPFELSQADNIKYYIAQYTMNMNMNIRKQERRKYKEIKEMQTKQIKINQH